MSQLSSEIDESPAEVGSDLESLLDHINRLANGEEVDESPQTEAPPEVTHFEPPTEPEHKPSVVSTDASVILALHARSKINRDADAEDEPWMPIEPLSLEEAGVSEAQLEHLILKFLPA